MVILEQKLCEKQPGQGLCEAGIFAGEGFAGVVSGLTFARKIRWSGHTGGYFAKEILLAAMEALEERSTAPEALEFLSRRLGHACGPDYSAQPPDPRERPQASLLLYSAYRRELWSFGSCQFLLDGVLYPGENPLGALYAQLRRAYLSCELLRGRSQEELVAQDPSLELLRPLVNRQGALANAHEEYGYPALDGLCQDFGGVRSWSIPEQSQLVLATEGYLDLKPTLAQSDAALEEIRREDPLCIHSHPFCQGFTDGNCFPVDAAYLHLAT